MKSGIKMKDGENNNELRTETCGPASLPKSSIVGQQKKKVNKVIKKWWKNVLSSTDYSKCFIVFADEKEGEGGLSVLHEGGRLNSLQST